MRHFSEPGAAPVHMSHETLARAKARSIVTRVSFRCSMHSSIGISTPLHDSDCAGESSKLIGRHLGCNALQIGQLGFIPGNVIEPVLEEANWLLVLRAVLCKTRGRLRIRFQPHNKFSKGTFLPTPVCRIIRR